MQEIVKVLGYKAAKCEDGEEVYGPRYGMRQRIYFSVSSPTKTRNTI